MNTINNNRMHSSASMATSARCWRATCNDNWLRFPGLVAASGSESAVATDPAVLVRYSTNVPLIEPHDQSRVDQVCF